mgnify:CR=1 FL=1
MLKKMVLLVLMLAALVACSRDLAPAPTPVATAPPAESNPQSFGGAATASGEIAPAKQAQLSFSLSGVVSTLNAQTGDRVVLLREGREVTYRVVSVERRLPS